MTGSSIVGVKYNNGVLIACDCALSFGGGNGMAKFFKQNRISMLNNNTIFTTSGELSDYQELL